MPGFTLHSDAFEPNARIPQKYTGEGPDVSPALRWTDPPAGTKSFALICEDPDAPRPTPWVHWLVWNIPADRRSLEENARGLPMGGNDFGTQRYGGPMPPKGHGVHHYYFRLYALDTMLDLPAGVTKEQLLRAMKGHILAEATLVGTYSRD